MTALVLRADLVAPVANMLAAAWAAGGIGAPADPVHQGVPGNSPAPQAREVSQDEGREQGSGRAPRPDGGDLRAPVDVGPGPRPHRVHRAPVRPGWRGVAAGLACGRPQGRCRSPRCHPLRATSCRNWYFLVTVVPFLVVSWCTPNTYPMGGVRRGTATQVPRDPGQPPNTARVPLTGTPTRPADLTLRSIDAPQRRHPSVCERRTRHDVHDVAGVWCFHYEAVADEHSHESGRGGRPRVGDPCERSRRWRRAKSSAG
jgi:hypothetical protein